jgi:hypothetical protein
MVGRRDGLTDITAEGFAAGVVWGTQRPTVHVCHRLVEAGIHLAEI